MTDDSRVLSGRYRIDESIGRGGMASVYRGYDLTLGRDVAIKILDPELARDAGFRTRFRLEAQAERPSPFPTARPSRCRTSSWSWFLVDC